MSNYQILCLICDYFEYKQLSKTLLNLQETFCGYLLYNLEMLQVEEKLNCETVSLTNDFSYFI